MIDPKHPRVKSLKIREKIVKGFKMGITSPNGLIAQGRGEAFDYLLGEKTNDFAKKAIEASAAMLLLAKYPALCVNGNTAALAPKEYLQLSRILKCPVEINLFHRTRKRQGKIKEYLKRIGIKQILAVGKNSSAKIKNIASDRKFVSPEGIEKADVVFVPLEDGDRTEALIKLGKKVITIDLNPLSRTAQKATITIVDNIVRALPELVSEIKKQQKTKVGKLKKILRDYNNQKVLNGSLRRLKMI